MMRVLLLCCLLAGCASQPTPWVLGPETAPLPGYIDCVQRGDGC